MADGAGAMSPLRAWYDRPGLQPVPDIAAAPPGIEAAFVTGKAAGFDRLPRLGALRRLSLREVDAAQLALAARLPQLEELRVFGYRGTGLAPLAGLTRLRALVLRWAPRLEGLEGLGALQGLEVLALGDLKRVEEFGLLAALPGLRMLHLDSPVGGVQRCRSLAPLVGLRRLEEVWLIGLSIERGGLRPLARMPWLRWLTLSNRHPLREMALLSVALPATRCDLFAPWVELPADIDAQGRPDPRGPSVMLTGTPVRHLRRGVPGAAAAIARREAAFAAWQAHYRALADPAADEPDG
jgi:hypothetical protein